MVAPPRTIPLLGYLVTASGPTPREVLSAALWPDAGEDEARVNLRRHLHHLHKALPPMETPWVRADGDAVEWSGDALVDVIEFRNALARNDQHAAAACYGGDFLEGFYDDWIIAHRERLTAAYLGALTDLLAESRSLRDHASALSYAQCILQIDEWREDVVRALMAVRYESGDRAGALGAFERFARRLAGEMHVDPMPETIALRDAIVRSAPISVAAREAPISIGSTNAAIPFVGRTEELSQLQTLWSAVARNAGGLAFVSGEAGIGKTRMVHEFALYAERQGARVLTGGTSNPETTPYEALIEALRSAVPYLAQSTLDPLWMGVLASIVPELQVHVPSGTSIEPIGEHRERARLLEAMARTLAALGRTRPFLVVLEDLHWAGVATVRALEFIARRLAGIPGIIVATYRNDEKPQCDELEQIRRSLEREHRAIAISPARLSHEHVETIVESVAQFENAPPHFVDTLYRTSEGNPLFVVHLLRDFAETGELNVPAAAGNAGIGTTILSRVARLSEAAQLLAEHAAVAGRTFSVDLLRDTTGWNEDDLLGALSELMERHLIRASFERSRYEYAFTHNLVQRGIYEHIPALERQRLHHRIAGLFERAETQRAGLAAETALHWDRAGEQERGARAYLRAADAAIAVYANETARLHARRVLQLDVDDALNHRALVQLATADERIGDKDAWERDARALLNASREAPPDRRFEALACAVRRFDSVGDRESQRSTLDEMKRIAVESRDRRQMAAALLAEGTMLYRQGVAAAAVEPLSAAVQASQTAGDAELHLQTEVALIKSLIGAGRIENARAEIARAQDELGEFAPLHHRLALVRVSAGVAMVREDSAELERIAKEQAELAQRVGDAEAEADAYRLFGYAAAYDGLDLETMLRHWSIAAQMFERAGASQDYALVLTDMAAIEVELGRYAEAERLLASVMPLAERIGWSIGTAICTLNKAEVHRCRSEFTQARELASRALELAQATDYTKLHCTALVFSAWVECKLGDFDAGLPRMREGIALRRGSGAEWSLSADLCLYIEALLLADLVDEAAEAARELERIYVNEPQRQQAPANICWTLARVRRAAGDDLGYRAYVERARTILEKRCARFKDEAIRTAFRSRPFCRELLAAADTADA
ncbi:MAG TPA: AAA family ATPase [Candidatus Baltobacteraceae bacterium]|nr:AAA family ATPase [Candidatus Baltobacteraceae bacterium]